MNSNVGKKYFKMNNKLLFVFFSLSIVAAFFYWFQWRPTQIKRECSQKVSTAAKKTINVTFQEMNGAYEFCLHEKGL